MAHLRRAARGLLITPDGEVLLMSFRFPWREAVIWITPGGSLQGEEDHRAALVRELREETGLIDPQIGAELWHREHLLEWDGRKILQQERYFLVETARFEPEACALESGYEQDWFQGHRWWSLNEIPDHTEEIAPQSLGRVVRTLLRDGVPRAPFGISV